MTEDQNVDQEVELHDNESEVVEEAHDPKNAESQAVDATGKAGQAGPSAKEPGGKGGKADPMEKPKTKAGMISAMYQKLGAMKKMDLDAAFDKMMDKGEEEKTNESVESSSDDRVADFNYEGELGALIESEATLSEEFKAKTAVIFEAALKSKLSEEIDRLEENYTTELAEEIDAVKTQMVDKVDSYLNYVVEQWMETNKIAIQNGLRTEIAEDFMTKLKDLFTESYVEVPESKVDLVDEQSDRITELEEQLNTQMTNAISVSEELEILKRDAIIAEASKGLAETQIEKLAKLVEDVTFDDEASFSAKVATIKETYFTEATKTNESIIEEDANDNDGEAETVVSSAIMEQYITAIRKSAN